jgi:putative ABC transport system permease protein
VVWNLLLASSVLLLILLAAGQVPLRYNLRNLAVRWKTTAMTALAFTAVIALLTVMLAFVNGMRRLTEGTGVPGNVIVLADGATDEAFSNLSPADVLEIENLQGEGIPPVLRHGLRPMASRETYMIVNQAVPDAPAGRPKRRFLQLRGVEDPVVTARVHEIELVSGQWFSDAGVRQLSSAEGGAEGMTAIEAVLGQGLAEQLGRDRPAHRRAAARNPRRLEVGDTFSLGERTWIVTGVMASAGSTFNSELWASRALVGTTFGKDTYTTLVMRFAGEEDAARFKRYLLEEHGGAAVSPQLETEYYASLSETNRQFLYAIGFLAVVMSVGGIFGVMNTMFAAISQRVKDIGVLRLLGYPRWQILVSFLLESLAIGLLGGLAGCALGSLCDGWTANSIVSSGAGGGKSVALQLAVDREIWAVGIQLTLTMAFLGGLLPALSAMRLRALEALR